MGIAVIGGGVAGITAALDLADAGYKVYLVEKNAQLGGKVSELAECETGISPLIVKIENHPNIELMLSSELGGLSGSAGDFKLNVSGKELNVESVVLTPGYDVYDDIAKGYAIDNPDVVPSLEFEGMLRACTVSETGALVRPSNGQPVKKIGFIKCIGSRCKENEICSTACCGYTAKEVWELKERYPNIDVYVFYMDVRVFGKDEELVAKLKDKYGVHYIRSRVPEVLTGDGTLTVKYEDLANGTIEQLDLDMVVLAVGLLPSKTMAKLAEVTGVNLDPYGFIETSMTSPVETSVPGIFAGGTATAPMKVRESVILSTGAASKAAQLSGRTEMIPGQEERKYVEVSEEPKIGVFICGCEGEVTGAMDVPVVAEHVGGLRGVAVVNSETNTMKETMGAVESGIIDEGLNRIVVAGYSPRAYEEIFRDTCAKAGLNPYLLEMVNLREQCACVHHEKEEATVVAMSQLTMAVERARYLEPVPLEQYPVTPKALVVGGGAAGMTAALDIANADYEVCLVEREAELGGSLKEATEFQSDVKAADVLTDLVGKVKGNERITVYTGAAVDDVRGRVGAFKAKVTGGGADEDIDFGAAVLATGTREFVPEGYFGYGQASNVVTQTDFAKMLDRTVAANTVVMIQEGASGDGVNAKYNSIEAVSNALKAKELKPELNVFVLFQDVKTYGKWEMAYKAAREKGVIFIRYDAERPPAFADGTVSVFDVIFNDEIQIKPDLIVVSALMQPAAENEQLSKMFMVPLKNGFFLEAQERPKLVLTPVDTVNEGVFICGSGVAPALIDESIGMGSAAASRACVLLAKNFLETPGIVSVVDEAICAGCGVCVEMCPVEAIELMEEPVAAVTYNIMTTTSGTKKFARVTVEGCIGCGSCAAYCPSNSISLQNFKAKQLYAQLDFA
jgi:heterodisulfide reductase subunit A